MQKRTARRGIVAGGRGGGRRRRRRRRRRRARGNAAAARPLFDARSRIDKKAFNFFPSRRPAAADISGARAFFY
jgi:hypothetical protein